MEPFQVIGNTASLDVVSGLVDLAKIVTFYVNDVRDPERNRWTATQAEIVHDWHQDGNIHRRDVEAAAVLLWSDTYPTEVLLPDDTITRGTPGDLVLLDNLAVKHRVPVDYIEACATGTEAPRTFWRGILPKAPTPGTVERWRRVFGRVAA